MEETRTVPTALHGPRRAGPGRGRLGIASAIAAALLAAGAASGEDGGTSPTPDPAGSTSRADVFPTPAIVVSATRIVDAPPTLIQREVTVADLEAYNAHTVGEGLIPVPGVNVQNGGTSGDLRAWIRGYRDRDTLVLFDGIPIASGFEGTIDLNEIATEQVGSIKVLKSAPSVIYGTNGIGGVIDIQPRNGADASLASANLEGGSDGRRLARGSSGAGNGNLSYLLSVSHDSAEDYSLSDDYHGELNQPPGERINSDFERNSVFLSLDAKETSAGHLSMFYNLSDAEKGLPPTAGVEEPDYERLDKSTRQTIGISDQLASIPLAVKAYYNQYESELTVFTDGTYRDIDEIEKAKDYSYGMKLYSTLRAGENNSVVLHASGQTDVYIGEGDLEDGNRAEITTWTAAIEDQYVITDTLSLAVGGIFNLFDQTLLDRTTTAFNPQAALAWQATDRLALHASAAQRTRFPKLRELYRRRYGNPDLDPQTAENYELGLTFAHSARYQSDFAWFHSDVHDLIERPDRRSHYENLAPVTIDGIELSTGGRLTDKLYTRLSYMYVRAEESLPGGGSRQLRSRPENTVQFELRYLFPWQLDASVNGVYVDGLHDLDDDDAYVALDSYFVANLKLAKAFGEHVSAYAAIANLLDENYEQRLGDPREGRSFRLGINWQL